MAGSSVRNSAVKLMVMGMPAGRLCLLVLCGLPGAGKSSLARDLLAEAAEARHQVQEGLGETAAAALLLHVVEFDEVERGLCGEHAAFDPAVWRHARGEAADRIADLLVAAPRDSLTLVM